jgi:hypothetical protein
MVDGDYALVSGDNPQRKDLTGTQLDIHTYAASVAEQVVSCIPDFLAEVTYLRDQLRQRLA